MNWGEVGQWVLTIGVAAVISAAVAYPKNKGEGKAGEGAGELSQAQAEHQRFEQYKETTDATIGHLRAEVIGANTVCTECRQELAQVKKALRATVRALDSDDPAALEAAIAAARELV